MNKKFKLSLSLFLTLGVIICSLVLNNISIHTFDSSPNSTSNDNNVNLILDSVNLNNVPGNFRKTSDLSIIKNNKNLNLTGLDTLNISGSRQFSASNLPILIDKIDTLFPVTIVDLRQESHGFVNEYPISWANLINDANIDLTKDQVILDQTNRLLNIKLNIPTTFFNHPNITIIPTKVTNESDLVNSKSLEYIFIPITDGKVPTDDMVDYFIEFVKSQPKNSWLHFHCKEGIGRSTTLMIMYDMIKNSKEVSADDIIKRQLSLANFNDDNDVKTFYTDERIDFLKNFYNYSKENNNDFKIKWSEWKKNLTSTSLLSTNFKTKYTSNYFKNPKIPTHLYVISQNTINHSERTMIATLQGLVNNHCSSQIYTLNHLQPDYEIWLNDLKNNYGVSYEIITNPWDLLNIFKNYVYGYVLYENKSKKDPSINNACSLASLNGCIAVDKSIENKIIDYGIKIKGDCRNTDENWAYNNLWNSELNHSIVIELSPNKDTALRDYAIMTKSLIFYEDSINNTSLRDKIFSSMNTDSICLGWGPDEFVNVSTASKHGVSVVAADWSYNLTVLSSFPSLPIKQKSIVNLPNNKSAHYVTFVISDGDNQQWYLGTNYDSYKWFGSPLRGKFNLGWSLSPSLYYLAPTVFDLYYKNTTSKSFNDYFIVSPSGNGYMYPSKFPKTALESYVNRLNKYMKKVNQKYVAIIDDSSFYNNNLWYKFTIKSNIEGLFYLDYNRHDNYKGKIIWSNNKPIVSCRDLLWGGLEDEDTLVKNINERIESNQIDTHNPNSYTFVYVHAWSKDLSNVEKVIDKLKQNPKVKIVTPKTFMELIKKNVKH